MSEEEFGEIVVMLLAFFPNIKLNTDDSVQMDLWYGMVKDLNFDITKLAIAKMVTDEQYTPSNVIGAIRKYYAEVSSSTPVADTDGYGLVQKAIRCYGYARPEEALASLPLNVREAVMACGGWLQICMSEEPESMRAQFNRAMASVNVRNNASNRLNLAVKKNIERLQEESDRMQMIEFKEAPRMDIQERKQSKENIEAMARVDSVLQNLRKGAV
ncbi:MAG: hypothetical protein E6370_17630 [Clostridiales bacterium]|jgi:hypothetical protein|nr:hypothetical protein [Clostridiales bacterium]MDU6976090.1 hypothetical protein [Clostridiales bacterium]